MVVGVARGSDVHVATAGVMTVGGAPIRRDTLFRISSITEPMTAAVVLSQIYDGLLDLDGTVEESCANWPIGALLRRPDGPLDDTVPAQRPITVRDLLTFTWGFGMQGAMFMAAEPWPIVTAAAVRCWPPSPGHSPTRRRIPNLDVPARRVAAACPARRALALPVRSQVLGVRPHALPEPRSPTSMR